MSRKVDPNSMSPQELEDYVNRLPDESPPKISSAGWLAAFAVIALILGISRIKQGTYDVVTWVMMGGGVLCLVCAGYIVYRIVHFNSHR